ncbi:phytoene/squalene synthase family protein [Sphingomonas tabacisoli]|uniref:Phytoene/squalene synthase family protein n=1 Tax=Sphingomonas tabacisoli TaxID=2249466 RepID=A0ABW4HXC2_9SPHN
MSSEVPTRDALVATAGETIARGSKSFGLASRLFDRRTRERAWLLYAWCRSCDDLADGQKLGGALNAVADPQARLTAIRALTDRALAGEWVGEAAFDGLRTLTDEVFIPPALLDEHIAGFALDAEGWRPRTEADLILYCHHVAGVVGRMMALVMGVPADDADTLERAEHLGLAFQLANIARDVREDAEAGRCYLPEDWLADGAALPLLTRRLAAMAADYEASARIGAQRLPFRARWAVLAAAGIYGAIAREVARQGEAALDRRVVVSRWAKLGWVFRALRQAL